MGGADHLAVAWQGPGFERKIVKSRYLLVPKLSPALAAKVRETMRREEEQGRLLREVERHLREGRTLPPQLAAKFPLPKQRLGSRDMGINVLLDHAHQVLFAMIWRYATELRSLGFRVAGSQATLDTVLKPGSMGRVRLIAGKWRPFGWVRLPEFNFFRKIGTSLRRERLPRIEFLGKTIELLVAPLDVGPAGHVRLEPAGDYTKPLRPRIGFAEGMGGFGSWPLFDLPAFGGTWHFLALAPSRPQ